MNKHTVMTRVLSFAFASLSVLIASAAVAQGSPITLRPGERAFAVLSGDVPFQVTIVTLSEDEQRSSIDWMMRPRGGAERQVPAVTPDVLRITFLDLRSLSGNDERLLLVENGYGRALRYRAVILQGDDSVPTSVCTVFPNARGVEHWPYPIDQIDLSNLTLVPYRAGDSVLCE